jgi:transcriptional regulator with XRE-family HTH domain
MNDLMFDIRALAATRGETIAELAEELGIKPQHLWDVSSGRSKLSSDDLVSLSNLTGIPVNQIKR